MDLGGTGSGSVWATHRRNFNQQTDTRDMVNPLEFLQEVRAEGGKVTWPSRRETLITTGLVIFMVLLASLFFVLVDWALRLVVTAVLGLGH
jgi:preprotein translocase subunit SecE